jgi:hypothetical protein
MREDHEDADSRRKRGGGCLIARAMAAQKADTAQRLPATCGRGTVTDGPPHHSSGKGRPHARNEIRSTCNIALRQRSPNDWIEDLPPSRIRPANRGLGVLLTAALCLAGVSGFMAWDRFAPQGPGESVIGYVVSSGNHRIVRHPTGGTILPGRDSHCWPSPPQIRT